jgi:hypothetical protein
MIALIWLCPGDAFSQSSANYQIARSVLDAGGGDRNSTMYAMCDSLGQVSGAAVSTSSNYRHIPGFYECGLTGGSPPPPPPPPPPAIPEPGTLILFGGGIIGLLILVRRRLKKH